MHTRRLFILGVIDGVEACEARRQGHMVGRSVVLSSITSWIALVEADGLALQADQILQRGGEGARSPGVGVEVPRPGPSAPVFLL